MEAKNESNLGRMPRVPMITPEMKLPEVPMPEELVPKLREYILTHFNDDPTKFNEAFSELQKMRYTVCRCLADVESLCVMKRYYAQLLMMKNRFPMESGEPVAVPFGWNDRSDMPNCVTYDDVNYELSCVLFNIAVGHSIIAMNETRSTEDSIKNAFMHFQCAAWPLQHLKDELGASKFGSSDFEPDYLSFFIKLLLAQAQECLIEKTITDGKKRQNISVARLSAHASEAYFELKVLVDHASISEYVPSSRIKSWKILCGAKGNLYAAISRYYCGLQSDEDKKYGERLYHFSSALNYIKEASKIVEKDKRDSLKQAVQYVFDIITQKEASARKENDFIYHERMPKAEELTQVEPVSLVKPIGFDPFDKSVSGDDLFGALLPANVLKGISMYSEEKAKLKRNIMEKIEDKDVELEKHLLALQLGQINLDSTENDMKLPEELLQCSAAYTSEPDGFFNLLEKLANLAKKSTESEYRLINLQKRLIIIKCPELEEDEGYKAISIKIDELIKHHGQASTNNTELQKALASQSEALKLLALPLNELVQHICSDTITASTTEEGVALRKMVDKVDEMKRQRMALFEALKSDLDNDDITSKILAEKDFTMQVLFDNEIKKHDKSLTLINMNLQAQEKILKALTEANANFAECRRKIVEVNQKKMQKSIELATAFQVYAGVKEKVEAASSFFGQLSAFINKLDPAVSGMENAYKKIKEKHDESVKIAAERAQSLREKTKSITAGMDMHSQPIRDNFMNNYYPNQAQMTMPGRQTFGELRKSGQLYSKFQNNPPTSMVTNIPDIPQSNDVSTPGSNSSAFNNIQQVPRGNDISVPRNNYSMANDISQVPKNNDLPVTTNQPLMHNNMPQIPKPYDNRSDYYSSMNNSSGANEQLYSMMQNKLPTSMVNNIPHIPQSNHVSTPVNNSSAVNNIQQVPRANDLSVAGNNSSMVNDIAHVSRNNGSPKNSIMQNNMPQINKPIDLPTSTCNSSMFNAQINHNDCHFSMNNTSTSNSFPQVSQNNGSTVPANNLTTLNNVPQIPKQYVSTTPTMLNNIPQIPKEHVPTIPANNPPTVNNIPQIPKQYGSTTPNNFTPLNDILQMQNQYVPSTTNTTMFNNIPQIPKQHSSTVPTNNSTLLNDVRQIPKHYVPTAPTNDSSTLNDIPQISNQYVPTAPTNNPSIISDQSGYKSPFLPTNSQQTDPNLFKQSPWHQGLSMYEQHNQQQTDYKSPFRT